MQVTDAELEAIMEVDRQSCGSKIAVRRALESVQISPPTDEEVRRAYAMTPGTVVGTTLIRGVLQNFVHLRNSPKFAEAAFGVSKHTESGTTYGKIMSALQGATLTPTEADRIAMNAKMAVTGFKTASSKRTAVAESVISRMQGVILTPDDAEEIADFAIKSAHARLRRTDLRREKMLAVMREGRGWDEKDMAELADKILKALDEVKP